VIRRAARGRNPPQSPHPPQITMKDPQHDAYAIDLEPQRRPGNLLLVPVTGNTNARPSGQGPHGTGTLTVADRLHALAAQVARLCPDRRDPERFFEIKSSIADELHQLARRSLRQ
jgi:hypothetical protein